MHIRPPTLDLASERSVARPARLANRVAAGTRRHSSTTYRTPSVLRLKSGPLHKLAWIFGLG